MTHDMATAAAFDERDGRSGTNRSLTGWPYHTMSGVAWPPGWSGRSTWFGKGAR